MKNQPKNLSELKDSRLLYEKKLPAFGYMIVLVVTGLLVGVLIWSIVTPKVYIIKGSGIIESANKNYIMSSYSGEISEMIIQNGDYVEKGDLLFSVKSSDLNLQQLQIKGRIEIYEKQISQLQKLEKSITDDISYFDANNQDDKQYYNQFEAYKAQIAQNSIDISAYKQYGYTDAQIDAEVKKNEGKISEIYHSTLKTIGENVNGITAEMENLKLQSQAIENGQSEYKITASTSGIVHMNADYKTGMVIQAGSTIGSIANEKDDYVIEAYINAADMPRAEIGNRVDVAIAGLSESTYGTVTGTLIYIDSDITTNQNNGSNGNNGGPSIHNDKTGNPNKIKVSRQSANENYAKMRLTRDHG